MQVFISSHIREEINFPIEIMSQLFGLVDYLKRQDKRVGERFSFLANVIQDPHGDDDVLKAMMHECSTEISTLGNQCYQLESIGN